MGKDFTSNLNGVNKMPTFRFWCQKVLPLVYDDSLSYYELLCKVVDYLNKTIENMDNVRIDLEAMYDTIQLMQDYMNTYFDNLDVQDEINAKLDELVNSGVLAGMLTAHFEKTPFLEIGDYKVFAQLIYDDIIQSDESEWLEGTKPNRYGSQNWGTQCSAVGTVNGVTRMISHHTRDKANDGILILTDFTTGERVAYKTGLSTGHGNGATFCSVDNCFYIACGGGKNSLKEVQVYDFDLNYVKTLDNKTIPLFNDAPYGIAYNEKNETFFVLVNTKIFEVNYEFNRVINQTDLPSTNELIGDKYTRQSMFTDGDYVYFIFNNLDRRPAYSGMDIFFADGLKYHMTQIIPTKFEIESGFIYNGNYYLTANSSFAGLIFKYFPFRNSKTGVYHTFNEINDDFMGVNADNDDYYANTEYTGFFIENTALKPFNRYYHAVNNMHHSNNMRRRLILTGDFTNCHVNFKGNYKELDIIGNDYVDVNGDTVKTQLGGAYFRAFPNLILNNLKLTKGNDVNSDITLDFSYCNYAYISNCELANPNAKRQISATSTNVAMINSSITESGSEYNVYCVENSMFRSLGYNTYVDGANQISSDSYLGYRLPPNAFSKEDVISANVFGGEDTVVDVLNIKKNGRYRFEENTGTVLNKPPAFKGNNFLLQVVSNNTTTMYTAWSYDGDIENVWFALANNKTTALKWRCPFKIDQVTEE